MVDSERVWLIVGADWPVDRPNDNDMSNITPRSIAVVPEQEASSPNADSSDPTGTGVVIALVFAVPVVAGALSLIADGVFGRRRRRRAAASNDGDMGLGEGHGPDAQPPQRQPGVRNEAAAVPGARPAAWNRLGRTATVTTVLVIAGALAWALYYCVFSLAEPGALLPGF